MSQSRLQFFNTPVSSGRRPHRVHAPAAEKRPRDSPPEPLVFEDEEEVQDDDSLQFQHRQESSNIQLFFDLFFVANLNTFTTSHEINSLEKLGSYIGFFCILWFTWCQCTLYDIRFGNDSVFERVCHALHFGLMVALAVIGPDFDAENIDWHNLQHLSLVLMAQRFILFFQYGSTLFATREYHQVRMPLALTMLSLAISGFVYLGVSFVFATKTAVQTFITWYVLAVLELLAVILISGYWPVLSFRNTQLVERMSCLTLIVLGEGIIGLTKTIAKIVSFDSDFSPGIVGSITSATLITYIIYQLYFDQIRVGNVSLFREQVWAFLHFPFHLAVVLLMEGMVQILLWRKICEIINALIIPLTDNVDLNEPGAIGSAFKAYNSTITELLRLFPPETNATGIHSDVGAALSIINPTSNSTDGEQSSAAWRIIGLSLKVVFEGYGFVPPVEDENFGGLQDVVTLLNTYFSIFDLCFGYVFVSAGGLLIGLAILFILRSEKAKRRKLSAFNVAVGSKICIGLGLLLLGTMVLTPAAETLGESAWTLPILVLVLGIGKLPARS
ncbi:MAG: hypothetical protein M1818_005516 [Claussenomyces sp. TS43310]|nr:MAG: hypothetical protein M1818_005516 [Claussenomyces sp. TS43310]